MSEALRLADALGIVSVGGPLTVTMHEAAAELRRLHAENEALKAELLEQARVNGMGGEREARLMAELERKSDAIQRLWKERDELRTLNAELVEALQRYHRIVIANAIDLDCDAAIDKAHAALAKAEASK